MGDLQVVCTASVRALWFHLLGLWWPKYIHLMELRTFSRIILSSSEQRGKLFSFERLRILMHREKQTMLWHVLIFKCFLCNYKVSKGPICKVVFLSRGFPTKLYKLHTNFLEDFTNIFLCMFFSMHHHLHLTWGKLSWILSFPWLTPHFF